MRLLPPSVSREEFDKLPFMTESVFRSLESNDVIAYDRDGPPNKIIVGFFLQHLNFSNELWAFWESNSYPTWTNYQHCKLVKRFNPRPPNTKDKDYEEMFI